MGTGWREVSASDARSSAPDEALAVTARMDGEVRTSEVTSSVSELALDVSRANRPRGPRIRRSHEPDARSQHRLRSALPDREALGSSLSGPIPAAPFQVGSPGEASVRAARPVVGASGSRRSSLSRPPRLLPLTAKASEPRATWTNADVASAFHLASASAGGEPRRDRSERLNSGPRRCGLRCGLWPNQPAIPSGPERGGGAIR